MSSEEENHKADAPETSKEDEIMERIVKYSQGCSFVVMIIITIIIFLLFIFFS